MSDTSPSDQRKTLKPAATDSLKKVRMSVRPARWWSHHLWEVREQDQLLTTINLGWFAFNSPPFPIGERYFSIRRRSVFLGWDLLNEGGDCLCEATKKIGVGYTLEVFDGRQPLTFGPKMLPTFTNWLRRDGVDCGFVRTSGIFSTRARAEFPAELTAEIRVFLLWLYLQGMMSG